MTSVDLSIALPEILLSLWAMVALMAGAYFGKDKLAASLTWATVAVLLLLAVLVGVLEPDTRAGFRRSVH